MLLRYAILGLLDGQELHGYRIKSAFEEQIGSLWPLNFGQIYQTLKDLRRRGLVEGRFDRGSGHVGRWMYTITAKGRRALETWLGRAPQEPQPPRDEILIRLLVLRHGDVASRLHQLGRQNDVYRKYVAQLTTQRPADDGGAGDPAVLKRLAADAAIFEAEARLRWITHCTKMLDPGLRAERATARSGAGRATKVNARAAG
jgi:DNA-binding PadR family transcriptional regulator